jgi:hypothetical protein
VQRKADQIPRKIVCGLLGKDLTVIRYFERGQKKRLIDLLMSGENFSFCFFLFYFGRCGNFHQVSSLFLEKLGVFCRIFCSSKSRFFSKNCSIKQSVISDNFGGFIGSTTLVVVLF